MTEEERPEQKELGRERPGLGAPQVPPEHYERARYESKERFISYWHQIDEVRRLAPDTLLEVGIGSGFVSRYLRRLGLDVTTLDFDARLGPDVVGSVLEMPFERGAFDAVACFEVLEHLPYGRFGAALGELRRVARRHVLLSLPDAQKAYTVRVRVPHVFGVRWLVPRPWGRPKPHAFDGEHYWEIGKAGYPLGRICADVEQAGFEVAKTYRVFEHPYHRFFVLEAR